MYAADIAYGRILAINLTTSSVAVLYQARDDLLPYTVAAGQQYIYFSAWNRKLVRILMAALRSRCGHYIFALWFLLSSLFSSPNLSGRTLDVYRSSTHGVALVRI